MNDHDIFAIALGVSTPWLIKDVEFKAEDSSVHTLHITLDFKPGTEFPCPDCGDMCKIHDTDTKSWRHLNFFQHETYIHARVPRTVCKSHKIKLVDVPWARSNSGFTLLFEAMTLRMAKYQPVAALAREIGEHDTRIWRILDHYVEQELANQNLEHVTSVGIDETAGKRRHDYVTIVADIDTRKVIHVSKGKGKECIRLFSIELEEKHGQKENIKEVSIDMSPSFISGVAEYLPKAAVTFDKFHIVKLLNSALAEVWREERKGVFSYKKTKFSWLKNPVNLTDNQKLMLEGLLKINTKTTRAYRLKLAFQELYKLQGKEGEAALHQWCTWAVRCRLAPMVAFAQMIKRHWAGVTRWFYSGLNNGILEGLNSLIQSAKARARGYRSFKNFRTMIFLIVGGLKFSST
jgi:transposase